MLIRNATALSVDPEVGDLPRGDILVEGHRSIAGTVLVACVIHRHGRRPLRDDAQLLERAEAITHRQSSAATFDRGEVAHGGELGNRSSQCLFLN
jgi:hypothetical protein